MLIESTQERYAPKDKRHLNDIQLFSNELKLNDGHRHFEFYVGNRLYDGTK